MSQNQTSWDSGDIRNLPETIEYIMIYSRIITVVPLVYSLFDGTLTEATIIHEPFKQSENPL